MLSDLDKLTSLQPFLSPFYFDWLYFDLPYFD